jgi:hypothetical protein
MSKLINFEHKTDTQIRMSYLNLKDRYRTVKFPIVHQTGTGLRGTFIVSNQK